MAQYVHTYVAELLKRQRIAANLLGSDPLGAGKELYSVNVSIMLLIGVIMKALTERPAVAGQPLMTDAEWIARLNTALDQGAPPNEWPAWIVNQTDPNA